MKKTKTKMNELKIITKRIMQLLIEFYCKGGWLSILGGFLFLVINFFLNLRHNIYFITISIPYQPIKGSTC